MTPDPRWLEILKASAWQTGALAIAVGVFLVLLTSEILPKPEDPLWYYIPTLCFLIFTGLFLAAIGNSVTKAINPARRIREFCAVRAAQHKVAVDIQYMTEQERFIISYLLHHKQKIFTTTPDGGYAATLVSKGIIRLAAVPGQQVDHFRVPFAIPDHIWTVLEQHRRQFPYEPPTNREKAKLPWAIPWEAR